MRVCLETLSMDERHKEIVRSDYNRDDQYNAGHKDALSDGDVHGKGTGSSGHGDWTPDCSGTLNTINYSNFDTDLSYHAGNKDDNEARQKALVKSKYDATAPYGADYVDTKMNVAEGQYVFGA